MAISQLRNSRLPLMNLIRMNGVPILQQLHLEEKLLRTSSDNWCIINDGTLDPTVVMGISGGHDAQKEGGFFCVYLTIKERPRIYIYDSNTIPRLTKKVLTILALV
ncbi:uncharacterized protein LOC110739506 [Chenopodium quinoa]|uniref:uncharacterized protein LOC110739506 n=1 Tax=Chenopodium quinoa TaxID=63459 RepID=UPI000B772FD1|nr:uncharacterized protein LOC110739506 [Chenopodium quinoa]